MNMIKKISVEDAGFIKYLENLKRLPTDKEIEKTTGIKLNTK